MALRVVFADDETHPIAEPARHLGRVLAVADRLDGVDQTLRVLEQQVLIRVSFVREELGDHVTP